MIKHEVVNLFILAECAHWKNQGGALKNAQECSRMLENAGDLSS